jgi:hypothetical protein
MTMNDHMMTRRGFVVAAGVALPVAAIFASRAAAADANLPKLDVNDPVAKALMYTEDATKVDKSKAPNYKPGQVCDNCIQYKPGVGGYGPCTAFPGKSVAAKGWCSAWVKKPA